MTQFCPEVERAWRVAKTVAETVMHRGHEAEGEEKGEVNVGHHAIVTKRDGVAQTLSLRLLSDIGGMFLTEEKEDATVVAQDRLITREGAVNVRNFRLLWDIDPFDGSSFGNRGLPEWSVSIAALYKGVHRGGAIVAPEVLGGFGVRGERGKGVEVWEENFSGSSLCPAPAMAPTSLPQTSAL